MEDSKKEKTDLFKVNSVVYWKWMGRSIEGKILKIFKKTIKMEIKGKTITRNGSSENPAYLVESSAGNQALKLASELFLLTTDNKKSPSTSKPKIFS